MITSEEDIQEIISLDYEILDVMLELKLRDWYKEHGLEFPVNPVLLNIMWMNYAKWN